MSLRLLAAALLLAALGVHVGLTVPMHYSAASAGDEYRRLREERRQMQARLARLERGESLKRRAEGVFASAGPHSEDVVRLVRRSVISSLGGASVSKVRVSVRPASQGSLAAAVGLSAEGDFEDVVALSTHVTRTGSGLVLKSVAFTPRSARVGLALEAVGLGNRS